MEEEAIHDLQGALLDVFVGPVDRVSGLEAHDGSPSLAPESLPGLLGGQIVKIIGRIMGSCQESDRTGQEDISLSVEGPDPRMSLLGGLVDLPSLSALIIRKLFFNLEEAQKIPILIHQDDLLTHGNQGGLGLAHG